MEKVKHIVIYNSNTAYKYTLYNGYSEAEAKRQIERLKAFPKVTHIFYKQGAGKYQVVKG